MGEKIRDFKKGGRKFRTRKKEEGKKGKGGKRGGKGEKGEIGEKRGK